MPLSAKALAELLRSCGASPEDIAAAAAELSQPTTTADSTPQATVPAPTDQAEISTSKRLVIEHHRPPISPTTAPLPLTTPLSESAGASGRQVVFSGATHAGTVLPSPSSIPAAPAPPTDSTGSTFKAPEPGSGPQGPQDATTMPITLSQSSAQLAVPNPGLWGSASMGPEASGASEYFSAPPAIATPSTLSAPPVHPSINNLARMVAASTFTSGLTQNLPIYPSPTQASPFELPAQRSSQWGASGVVANRAPSALPSVVASALPIVSASPQKATAPGPWITSTTPIPKPNRRKSSSTGPSGPVKKVIPPKTVYLIPQSQAPKLDGRTKAGCDLAGLSATPEFWTSMSSAEVRTAIEASFTKIIDFATYSYSYYHVSRDLGNALCPTPFTFPTGNQIYSAYHKKTIIILRLDFDAKVPLYEEGLRLWDRENRPGRSAQRKKQTKPMGDDEDEEDEDGEGDMESFVCGSCKGTFPPERFGDHETKCPARRKRTLSTRSTHSRHQSVPAILSPDRKRIRYQKPMEASSDGEADERLVFGKRERGFHVDDDIDEDEMAADPDADEDEDNVEDNEVTDAARTPSNRTYSEHDILCAFCDDPLPLNMDPKYWEVRSALVQEAEVQPTQKNPDHLELPAWRAFEACQFHQESRHVEVAKGLATGYPEDIDFSLIPSRLKGRLTALEDALYHQFLHSSLEALRYGARGLRSTQERLAATDRAHAGYYGPKGFAVILDFLVKKFPPHSFAPSSILSSSDFLFFMLAPYATFLLISEDMPNLSSAEVWEVWNESKAFGVARFPDDQ